MSKDFRVAIVGLGNQGRKRNHVAGSDVVASIDPVDKQASHRRLEDVPLELYDAALVCTPETAKAEIITYLLANGKHVLVEKPFLLDSDVEYHRLKGMAESKGLACYTAYNHRFEPAIQALWQCLSRQELGEIYKARLFYGNGTARDVRESVWRDKGAGVITDLGSHVIDLADMLFSRPDVLPETISINHFENSAPDNAHFVIRGQPLLEFEVSLLSWKNAFTIDVIGAKGSAQVDSLVKWGSSTFTKRSRRLPSGRPDEETQSWVCADPTWALEYTSFKKLCQQRKNELDKDAWIASSLRRLTIDLLPTK